MIKLILAEDANLVRGAMVALLELEPDVTVVAEVGSGDEIVPAALKWRPDVAIIDIDLSDGRGLSAAAELRTQLPECRVLILTGVSHPTIVRRALTFHVDGLLLKDVPPSELVAAVRKTVVGERVIDPQLALTAFDGADGPLTPREVDVLRLAAEGEDVQGIAAQLNLSVGTVRNYLTAIVNKLSARNLRDAIRIARVTAMI